MLVSSWVTILLVVIIVLLVISLILFFTSKHLKRVSKRHIAEEYRGKGALLPIANIHHKPNIRLFKHPSMHFDDSFRKSFYTSPLGSPSSSGSLTVPEIRITFAEEDLPPLSPRGQRTSRVVVVQIGESGAAYVRPPPPYEGFQDVDMTKVGGLREKQ